MAGRFNGRDLVECARYAHDRDASLSLTRWGLLVRKSAVIDEITGRRAHSEHIIDYAILDLSVLSMGDVVRETIDRVCADIDALIPTPD